MPVYAFHRVRPEDARADRVSLVVAEGADAAKARAAGEALLGEPGALARFEAVDLASAPAFVVQGHVPVGSRDQTTWATLTRGGDPLRGT